MEALIAILIFIGGAIWNVIQKRKQEQEDAKPWLPPTPRRDGTQPNRTTPPAQRPPPRPATDWEEQLRRLLQGEPAQAPPVIVVEQQSPAPPPLPGTATASSRRPRARIPEPEFDESMDIGLPVRMPSLTQSAQAWQRGNQLEATVAERFRQVDQRIASHQPAQARRATSSELQQAIHLVRNRSSQRAAIVASIILGPPKALEV